MPAQTPNSAFRHLKQTLDNAVAQQDKLHEYEVRQKLGLLFYRQGHFAQAIRFLLQAQRGYRSVKAADLLAGNLNELGTVYYYNRQPRLARKQFDEALLLYNRINNRSGLARTYGNLGHLYEKTGNLSQAFDYQKRALATYQTTNDQLGLAKIHENIGSIFEDRGQLDSAQQYYQNALQLTQKRGDKLAQLEIVNNLGDIYRKTGNYKAALTIYRDVLQRASQHGESYQLNSVYRDLGKTFQSLHQHDSAYYYFEQSHELMDQIYATENNKQIALLQTLFEVEQKDGQIARLNAEQRINTLLMVAGGLLLLLVGTIAVVVIGRQRLRISNERSLHAQNRQILQTQNELIQVELQNKQLAEENLRYQLELKGQELSTHTLHLIQKNQAMEELKKDLTDILNDDKRDQRKQLKQLVQKIGTSFSQDKSWEDFRATFDQVHPTFLPELMRQYPDLSPAELRLTALLRINMNSADIATLLSISPDSLRVARYRLRKKLNLSEGDSLTGFIQRFSQQTVTALTSY
ncbi:tetratricopeptide repeat protein [Spirosoma fluminis]